MTAAPVATYFRRGGSDERALFTDAFVEHAPRLYRYLARQLSPTEAEDVLAETFCTAWQHRARYREVRGPMIGWLFGIATNLLKRHKRSWLRGAAAVSRLAVEHGDDHADEVARRVDAEVISRALADALASLDPRDRDVLLLSSWAQLDHAEIATALDIPVGTVRSRLHRARRRLLPSIPESPRGADHA